MAQSLRADATASAVEGSSGLPPVMVSRSERYTALGNRACCTLSLKTREPKISPTCAG
jgi:hypothetical protein